jgi:5-methylthioadenosine/S-adenosylhomocysteine deaminase
MEWLNEHIWPLERRVVSEAFVRDGTRLALAEMIRAGITCFSDMYFFPEVAAEVARGAGLRCQVAFPIIAFANAWSSGVDEALHKGMALHDAYRNHPLVRVAFGPHAAYSVTRSDLERILMYAEELDAAVHIHLHETAAEVAEARARHGMTDIALLDAVGLLGPRLQAVHVTQADDDDVARLAEARVQVVHCPHSNLKLASGICPVNRLLGAGINVALGTDGAASNNALDLLAEARLASLLAKIEGGDARCLPEWRALEMATLGGARALGLDAEIGSLEPGKLADLVAVDLRSPRFQPVYDPMAQLVHAPAGSAVSHVWVAGRTLLDDGELVTLDQAAVLEAASGWRERIAG